VFAPPAAASNKPNKKKTQQNASSSSSSSTDSAVRVHISGEEEGDKHKTHPNDLD